MVRIIKKSLIRTWLKKLKRHNSIAISILGYENMEKYPIYVSKQSYEEKHVDLLLIGEEGKRHHVLIKDFNAFMFDHTWHCGKKCFYGWLEKIQWNFIAWKRIFLQLPERNFKIFVLKYMNSMLLIFLMYLNLHDNQP